MKKVLIDMPLVSIGIPAYNRPDGLMMALQCIKNQTYPNLEVIVSDDCSPSDRVGKVVNEAILSGQQISFYRQSENIGATRNFEFVLTRATGKYFLWADDEDLLEPEFVGKLVECMESQPDLVACTCDIKTIDHHDNFVGLNQLNTIRPSENWNVARKLFFQYPTSNIFFCILGMFKTESLKRSNIRNLVGWKGYETNGEVPFLAQIATFGRMAAIPEALKTYRLNPDSIYHSEIRSISRFDWFMLRLVIRFRLCKIAVASELPILAKASLLNAVLVSYMLDIKRVVMGAVMAWIGRIKRLLKGVYGAR
jgi:glycosyltransferase involved in cell wall biosynthesis